MCAASNDWWRRGKKIFEGIFLPEKTFSLFAKAEGAYQSEGYRHPRQDRCRRPKIWDDGAEIGQKQSRRPKNRDVCAAYRVFVESGLQNR